MSRMLELYRSEVAPALMQQFSYKTPMQIPRLDKVVINVGVGDAKENAKANKIENVELEAMDASKFDKPIDACIIDPPRKGCSSFMIDTLLRLKPKRIVYVSCNPDTMCHDIKSLSAEYELSSPVYTYNMFPRTSHVESVVYLERKEK